MIKISKFRDEYTNDVIDLVLHFQNDGTRPPVSVNDQPDLLYITEKYTVISLILPRKQLQNHYA